MSYDQVLHELGLGFPAASFEATFVPHYISTEVVASISIERIGERSITWRFLYHDGAGTKVWEGRKVTVASTSTRRPRRPSPMPSDRAEHFVGGMTVLISATAS